MSNLSEEDEQHLLKNDLQHKKLREQTVLETKWPKYSRSRKVQKSAKNTTHDGYIQQLQYTLTMN